jgi:hypothetical protein
MLAMNHALSPLTNDLIEALVASAWLWLGRLMGVLVSPRAERHKRRLTRLVQIAERWVEHILFVAAAHRLGSLRPRRRRINARVIARPGFRIARGDNRLLWKSARIRLRGASLTARVERLIDALANPEPYIARYIERLARGLCCVLASLCSLRHAKHKASRKGAKDIACAAPALAPPRRRC